MLRGVKIPDFAPDESVESCDSHVALVPTQPYSDINCETPAGQAFTG